MTAQFPTTILNTTNMPDAVATDTLAANQHTKKHNDLRDEIIALETKVGVDGSAVTSTLDYKLKNTASVDPGHKHSVSSISATGTPDSTTFLRGDGKWVANSVSDASTTVKGVTKLSVAPAVANDPIAVGTNDGRIPTQEENDALQGTSGTPSNTNRFVTNDDTGTSGANKVLRLNGSGQIPPSLLSTSSKVFSATRLGTTASGTQVIAHGLGKTPSFVRVDANFRCGNVAFPLAKSVGIFDGTNQYYIGTSNGTSTNGVEGNIFTGNGVVYIRDIIDTSGWGGTQVATVSVDATNITLTWTKTINVNDLAANNINMVITAF